MLKKNSTLLGGGPEFTIFFKRLGSVVWFKGYELGARHIYIKILAPPLTGCVTLDELPSLSVPLCCP